MRRTTVVAIALCLSGCGHSPSPVADYLGTVGVELFTDGKAAFVYLFPPTEIPPKGCPYFGALATIDGREMEVVQLGGETWGHVDSDARFCGPGSYRVPFARGAESRYSTVRIADPTGEITFSALDTLTDPALVWESASELPPSGLAELRVEPGSLSFAKVLYADIVGLEATSGRKLSASVSKRGTHLWFQVPADAPAGSGQIRLQYEWEPQLSAPVLECKGATKCSAGLRFAETAGTPITVIPAGPR